MISDHLCGSDWYNDEKVEVPTTNRMSNSNPKKKREYKSRGEEKVKKIEQGKRSIESGVRGEIYFAIS